MGVKVIKKDGGSGGGGSTAWGDITGTLADQTDLQTALDSAGGGFWDETVVQDNEQTVTNSTTLVDSDDLQISLEANSDYLFEVFMILDDDENAGASGAGVKFHAAYTGTTSADAITGLELRGFGQIDRRFIRALSDTSFNKEDTYIKGSVFRTQGSISTITAGTLKMQFAQNLASASDTAYLRIGSTLSVKKVS